MKFIFSILLFLLVLVLLPIALPLALVAFIIFECFSFLKSVFRTLFNFYSETLLSVTIWIRGYEKKRLGRYDYLDNRDARELELEQTKIDSDGLTDNLSK